MIGILSFIGTAISYASSNDDNHLSANDSVYSPPGYMNKDIQQARSLADKYLANKDKSDNKTEATQREVSQKVQVQAQEKPKPQLKQKQSSKVTGKANTATVAAAGNAGNTSSTEIPAYIMSAMQNYVTADSPVLTNKCKFEASNGIYYAFWNEAAAGEVIVKAQVFDANGNAMNASSLVLNRYDAPRVFTLDTFFHDPGPTINKFGNGNVAVFWTDAVLVSVEDPPPGRIWIGGPKKTYNTFLKMQVFDSKGHMLYTTPFAFNYSDTSTAASMVKVTALENGNLFVSWSETDLNKNSTLKAQVFNQSGSAIFSSAISLGTNNTSSGVGVTRVFGFTNGNIAVFLGEQNYSTGKYIMRVKILSPNGSVVGAQVILNSYGYSQYDTYIDNVLALSNGNIAVFWRDTDSNRRPSLRTQVFSPAGKTLYTTPISLTGGRQLLYFSIQSYSTLPNGNVVLSWFEKDLNSKYSIRTQAFNSTTGAALYSTSINLNPSWGLWGAGISGVYTFANGNIAIFWEEITTSYKYALKYQIYDTAGVARYSAPLRLTSSSTLPAAQIAKVSRLANGNLAVFWRETNSAYKESFKFQVLGPTGSALYSTPVLLTGSSQLYDLSFESALTFANGNMAIIWTERQNEVYNYSIKGQIIDKAGNLLYAAPFIIANNSSMGTVEGESVVFSNDKIILLWSTGSLLKTQTIDSMGRLLHSSPVEVGNISYAYINGAAALADGRTAVFWQEAYHAAPLKTQVLDSAGGFVSANTLKPAALNTSSANTLANNSLANSPFKSLKYNALSDRSSSDSSWGTSYVKAGDNTKSLKTYLKDKGVLVQDMLASARGPQEIADKTIRDSLKGSALATPVKDHNAADMETAMRLSNIVDNPTGDQRVILDTIKAILSETEKAKKGERDAKANEELAKAEDSLLKAAASALLAQAMPDLIKKGDMANIKGIFQELDTQRNKIMLDYSIATKPYYENMIKDMANNIAMLQAKNLLNPNMSKDELSKLPPSELDKILDKIRNMKDKSFEEKYLLQREAEYRHDYLDPNNKKLEDNMKGMLSGFTGKINDVLKSADKK